MDFLHTLNVKPFLLLRRTPLQYETVHYVIMCSQQWRFFISIMQQWFSFISSIVEAKLPCFGIEFRVGYTYWLDMMYWYKNDVIVYNICLCIHTRGHNLRGTKNVVCNFAGGHVLSALDFQIFNEPLFHNYSYVPE